MKRIEIAILLPFVAIMLTSCVGHTSTRGGSDTLDGERAVTATPDTISLLFVGDAMQHAPQLRTALSCGGDHYDYSGYFDLLFSDIKSADYAVVNLEVPLGGGPEYSGYPQFSSPDAYARSLVDAGFDMLLTANNHCLDSGDNAAVRTLSVLDSLGVDHIGTYANAAHRAAKVPFIRDIKGAKIAFLNYTYGTNGLSSKTIDIAYIDRGRMANEMEAARKDGADFVIVTLHWGTEYQSIENQQQRDLTDYLIANGADMIIGSHPHVVQPMKVVHNEKRDRDVLVVYSLGNFMSNMDQIDTRGGALVRTRLVREPSGNVRFLSADNDLFFVAKPEGENRNFKLVPSWQADLIPPVQQAIWQAFRKNAAAVFDKHNVGVPTRHP